MAAASTFPHWSPWSSWPTRCASPGIVTGEVNIRKIWSAANMKVYGGGAVEDGFLRTLSDLVGDYNYTKVSISSGKSGRSRSRLEVKERIFDVSNVAELDHGRAGVWRPPWCSGLHKGSGRSIHHGQQPTPRGRPRAGTHRRNRGSQSLDHA